MILEDVFPDKKIHLPLGTLPDLSITSLALSCTETMISKVATSSLFRGLRTNTAPENSQKKHPSVLNKTKFIQRTD